MRLARYKTGGRTALGVVVNDEIADVADLGAGDWDDPVAILAAGPPVWERLQEAAAASGSRTPLSDVVLEAPIARPSKYLAIGFNSHDHAEEVSRAPDTPYIRRLRERSQRLAEAFPEARFPLTFNKQISCISGPTGEIWLPRDSTKLDYEGEVAVVIGTRIRRADEEEASQAIAAYTVVNDVSVRDWQGNTSQMWLGKSFDTHGPTGPWLTTADEVDVASLRITTFVNSEKRQEGLVAEQILSPAAIISALSQVCTLEPGDLIATGTPSGIGSLSGRYLVAGDVVRVTVDGLGSIEHTVVPEPANEPAAAVGGGDARMES